MLSDPDVALGPRPTQAVILAGGRGSRMRPFTDTNPKPMVPVHGKPFLEQLIGLLRLNGFERVLLLLGYLPNVIQDYFADGARFGLQIEYAVSDVDDETGRRLTLASSRLDDCFVLLYCDNYWPMRFDDMWRKFKIAGVPAMVTVYSNRDGYTRNNVRVVDGHVVCYDKSRTASGLNGVEIGYAFLTRHVVDLLPRGPLDNVSFEQAAYPALVAEGQLLAYVTDHRYYSIGSYERLPLTEAFFAEQKTIILDRDGVLNRKPAQGQYVRHWQEFEWLPGAREALRLLKVLGYRVIVVSNQAGIARGMMTETDLALIHEQMRVEAAETGGTIDSIYYCPHGWDDGCECRKPKPGMLYQAQRDWHLDLTRTYFIGDDPRDREAGESAGCPWALVSDEAPLIDFVRRLTAEEPRQFQ